MQLLSVVNPQLGKRWFDILWELPYEGKNTIVSLEKLYETSISACSQEKRLSVLSLLGADIALTSSFGLPKGDKPFIYWLAKEVWMDQLIQEAERLLQQVIDSMVGKSDTDIVRQPTLTDYFLDIQARHRAALFENLKADMTVAAPADKQIDMKNATRRLVFR